MTEQTAPMLSDVSITCDGSDYTTAVVEIDGKRPTVLIESVSAEVRTGELNHVTITFVPDRLSVNGEVVLNDKPRDSTDQDNEDAILALGTLQPEPFSIPEVLAYLRGKGYAPLGVGRTVERLTLQGRVDYGDSLIRVKA